MKYWLRYYCFGKLVVWSTTTNITSTKINALHLSKLMMLLNSCSCDVYYDIARLLYTTAPAVIFTKETAYRIFGFPSSLRHKNFSSKVEDLRGLEMGRL